MVFVFIVGVVLVVVELSTFYQTIKTTCCVCLFVARGSSSIIIIPINVAPQPLFAINL